LTYREAYYNSDGLEVLECRKGSEWLSLSSCSECNRPTNLLGPPDAIRIPNVAQGVPYKVALGVPIAILHTDLRSIWEKFGPTKDQVEIELVTKRGTRSATHFAIWNNVAPVSRGSTSSGLHRCTLCDSLNYFAATEGNLFGPPRFHVTIESPPQNKLCFLCVGHLLVHEEVLPLLNAASPKKFISRPVRIAPPEDGFGNLRFANGRIEEY
jgi:hypothetical protein